MSEEDFRNLVRVFATFDEVVEVINSKSLVYIDRTRFIESY